jgi:hypothetical protein
MTIETLFNVGDEVCYLQGTKLKENVIHSIDTESKGDGTKIRYCFKDKQTMDWEFANESNVFASMEGFFSQLTDKIIEMEIDFDYILKKIKDDE